MVQIKVFSDQYLAKLLDNLAKFFSAHISWMFVSHVCYLYTVEKVFAHYPIASYFCLCIIDACFRARKLETAMQSNLVGGDRSRRQERIN